MGPRQQTSDRPRRRRSKTVWPLVFGVLLLVMLVLILAFSLGWIEGGEL
jgi:predicted nucleic acid-binding Zn ribbon protein